jgi:hypothetical protein
VTEPHRRTSELHTSTDPFEQYLLFEINCAKSLSESTDDSSALVHKVELTVLERTLRAYHRQGK